MDGIGRTSYLDNNREPIVQRNRDWYVDREPVISRTGRDSYLDREPVRSTTGAKGRGRPDYIKDVYKSNLDKAIQNITRFLKPEQAFTEFMPYEQYAAPQRAVFDAFVQGNLRPEFERLQLDPYQRQSANALAAGPTTGKGYYNYQRGKQGLETGFANTLEQARSQYEDYVTNLFNQQLRDYYGSPLAFTNI